jgi:hypothetical protein
VLNCCTGTIYHNDASNSRACCQSNNIIEGKCCESGDDLLNENGECCNANTEQCCSVGRTLLGETCCDNENVLHGVCCPFCQKGNVNPGTLITNCCGAGKTYTGTSEIFNAENCCDDDKAFENAVGVWECCSDSMVFPKLILGTSI